MLGINDDTRDIAPHRHVSGPLIHFEPSSPDDVVLIYDAGAKDVKRWAGT